MGGVKDLIHPEDRAATLCAPTVDALSQRLADALRDGVVAARPLVHAEDNERVRSQSTRAPGTP